MNLETPYRKIISYPWHPYVFIAFVGTLVYGQTLFFDFSYYDDDFIILKNFDFLRELSNVTKAFQQPYFDYYYRPVVQVSFILDAQIGKLSPLVYHASNICFHLITSCFVFVFLSKLFLNHSFALIAALLYVVHPLAVQTVAWIPGRNDSLVTMFVLASCIFLMKYYEVRSNGILILHGVLFMLALFSKETALMLPIVCLMYVLLIRGESITAQANLPLVICWGCVLFFYFMIKSFFVAGLKDSGQAMSMSVVAENVPALVELLGKSIIPVHLSAYATLTTISTVIGVVVILLFMVFIKMTNRERRQYIAFGLSWFFIFMMPSLLVAIENVRHRFDYLENRAYLPLVGIMIALSGFFLSRSEPRMKKVRGIGWIIIILFSWMTIVHSKNFSNAVSLWSHVIETSPRSAEAHYYLGTLYEDSGNLDRAAACYLNAAQLDSTNTRYYNNLGVVYAQRGFFREANEVLTKAITREPRNHFAYYNLGSVYYLSGNFTAAESLWKKAVDLKPDLTDAYDKLITLYREQHRLKEADEIRERMRQMEK
ncbi:MAG: tetratricopeptide repeat protein [Ignavibacteriae bacterium]|nr:tetratricopeptide repeat protein [Ignavibacteriota bacterium]